MLQASKYFSLSPNINSYSLLDYCRYGKVINNLLWIKIRAIYITALLFYLNRTVIMQEHNQLVTQNLYQLPSCSICLNQLTENMASLGCGHTFHTSCIYQQFQYKGTCPNCQKRSSPKEIRPVVFPVVHNTKTGSYLKALIENIDKTQGQQVHGLLGQIKSLSQKSQKLEYNLIEAERELKKKIQQSEKNKREIESKTVQANSLRKQNTSLNRQLVEVTTNNDRLQLELIQLRNRRDQLQSQRRQIQHYKQIQKTAEKNSQQLMKFKNEMEGKTTPQMMAKSFFEMLQLKNLSILKMKQKQRQYAQKYRIKQSQFNKLKMSYSDLQALNDSFRQEGQKWRNKFEKLRDKYREIVQKMRTKSQQNIQNDKQIQQNSLSLSIGFSNKIGLKGQATISAEKNEKNEKQLNFNIVQKPKAPPQCKIYFGNQALKKQTSEKSSGQITLKNFMN